jgi:excisionase family DNA binding protein
MAREAPKKPAQIDDLLTVAEVAQWVGVHADTIRSWIAHGQIEAYNVGTENHPRYRVQRRVVLEKFKVVRAMRLR